MIFTALAVSSILSLSYAAPITLAARESNLSNTLKPITISLYSGATGGITPNVATGSATKTPTGDITTLVTFENKSFDVPSTCRLRFHLDNLDTAVVLDGTKEVGIFSSLNPAPAGGSKGWGGPGNQRNIDLGRFKLVKGGDGSVVYATGLDAFPCPKRGAGPVGFEVVPIGDVDRVEWSAALSGLYLTW
jgi:hypothetical protein